LTGKGEKGRRPGGEFCRAASRLRGTRKCEDSAKCAAGEDARAPIAVFGFEAL